MSLWKCSDSILLYISLIYRYQLVLFIKDMHQKASCYNEGGGVSSTNARYIRPHYKWLPKLQGWLLLFQNTNQTSVALRITKKYKINFKQITETNQ